MLEDGELQWLAWCGVVVSFRGRKAKGRMACHLPAVERCDYGACDCYDGHAVPQHVRHCRLPAHGEVASLILQAAWQDSEYWSRADQDSPGGGGQRMSEWFRRSSEWGEWGANTSAN